MGPKVRIKLNDLEIVQHIPDHVNIQAQTDLVHTAVIFQKPEQVLLLQSVSGG